MCYVYSNDRMLSVYLREVHVGTLPEICSSATIPSSYRRTIIPQILFLPREVGRPRQYPYIRK